MSLVLAVLGSYIGGSIPFGFIAGRLLGIDVRRHGSGNIGATNVLRVMGPAAAVPVLLLDAAKGIGAVYLGRILAPGLDPAWVGTLAGMAAIIGHNWSIFLGFRGGKGVATSAGVALVLIPRYILYGLIIFVVVIALTRYVSLGSLVAAAVTAMYVLIGPTPLAYKLFAAVGAGFIIIRHRANIKRLMTGQEARLGQRAGRKG